MNLDAKQVTEIINKAVKPIIVDLASVKGAVQDLRNGQTSQELQLRRLNRKVEEMDDKVGSLIVDTIQLKDEVGALGDKIDANVDTTKRQIREIREELNLPTS